MKGAAMVDLDVLLAETKELPPCGPNLEHDLSFFELEEAGRPKPEQRVGEAIKPAEEADWPKIVKLSQGLFLRSKDLRVAVHLARGLTRTEGVPGLAAGLTLIHGLLDRYWGGIHPLLESEYGDDPTERLSALAPLCDPATLPPGAGDETIIKDLRDVELARSREHGVLQARDVEIALGRLAQVRTDTSGIPKTLGQIHAQLATAFATDRTVPSALREARERVLAIDTLLVDRVGTERTVDLKPLANCLGSLLEACDTALGTRERVAVGVSASSDGGEAIGASPTIDGQIRTRDDAVRMLDLVCRYLERHEPSNPAPLFIRRAQRLMTKNFMEIVKDLLPDSLSNIERLAGEAEPKAE
jgi:type VI secretion system protein ImpA